MIQKKKFIRPVVGFVEGMAGTVLTDGLGIGSGETDSNQAKMAMPTFDDISRPQMSKESEASPFGDGSF